MLCNFIQVISKIKVLDEFHSVLCHQLGSLVTDEFINLYEKQILRMKGSMNESQFQIKYEIWLTAFSCILQNLERIVNKTERLTNEYMILVKTQDSSRCLMESITLFKNKAILKSLLKIHSKIFKNSKDPQ